MPNESVVRLSGVRIVLNKKEVIMTCKGCEVDLRKAVDLPLIMSEGILIVVCPMCRYRNTAKTDDDGNVVVLFGEG